MYRTKLCPYNSEFPPGCTSFIGPHETECLFSIWRSVGCLDFGARNSGLFDEGLRNAADGMDL